MTVVAERQESFVPAFAAFRRDAAFGPDWLRTLREAAFDRFCDDGFPTPRQEDWRFTNVTPIADTKFELPAGETSAPDAAALAPYAFPDVTAQIVVVNGRVSNVPALPEGVTVSSMRELWRRGAKADDVPVGSIARGRQPFLALNTAFFDDGLLVRVAPKTVVEAPIHVLFVAVGAASPLMISPRLLVVAGEGAQVCLIESYTGSGPGTTLTNPVTEFIVGERAIVDHVKIQRELPAAFHIANVFAKLGRASTFSSHAISFGGRIARNDIVSELAGEGAECTLNGLYVIDGNTLFDTHTTIDHAMPHCPSHEVYKGILAGKSRAVFNGKIIVRPDAQKTDAKQTNKALLLTDDAQINTKPQLEIFADDVRCTHGAAIGQLDEEAMFYLRARGLDEPAARSLLIHAFAGEILDGLRVESVRERVMHLMEQKLAIA